MRTAALILVSGLAACSRQPQVPVDDILASAPVTAKEPATLLEQGEALQAEAFRSAEAARAQATARPDDVAAQVAAARAFFVAADLERRRGLVASLDDDPSRDVDELLGRMDDLPDDLRARVGALAEAGMGFGERAVAADASSAGARFYYAGCLGFTAWSMGARAAIGQGLAGKVKGALDAAVDADERFAGGAPLRARAGYYGRAPWPVGNKKKARADAARAVEIAGTALNHAYLAEMLWRSGEKDAALEAWERALAAPVDDEAPNEPFVRAVVQRALKLGKR